MGATPPTVFIPIPLKLHWCFGHGIKICMRFGYDPQIFGYFFNMLNLAIFGHYLKQFKWTGDTLSAELL